MDGETLQVFIRLFPEIIKTAAASPLGIIALIVLCVSIVIVIIFGKDTNGAIRLAAFALMIGSTTFFGWIVVKTSANIIHDEEVRNTVTGQIGQRDMPCDRGAGNEIKARQLVRSPAGRYFVDFRMSAGEIVSHGPEQAGCFELGRNSSTRPTEIDIIARADCGSGELNNLRGRRITAICTYVGRTAPLP